MNYGYVMTLIKAISVTQTTNDLRPLNAISTYTEMHYEFICMY